MTSILWYSAIPNGQGVSFTQSSFRDLCSARPVATVHSFGEGGPAALIFEQSGGSPPPSARDNRRS